MMATAEVLFSLYEAALEPARARLEQGRALESVLAGSDAAKFARFMIFVSAFGLGMTEPVPQWIRRAGERSSELGFTELGRALVARARHEGEHYKLMLRDLDKLTDFYAAEYGPGAFDVDALLAEPYPPGVESYRRLREELIAGSAPFAELAVDYELEALSVRVGPRLLDRVGRLLGTRLLEALSLVDEQALVDARHTRFNQNELVRLLSQDARVARPLVQAGTRALDAYGAFLDDCWLRAERPTPR
jgi:hypothetical protein